MRSILTNLENTLQGILIILIIYHTMTFLFTRDKSFGTYAIYLAVVFYFLLPDMSNQFSRSITEPYPEFFRNAVWLTEVIFILSYAVFTIHFLNLDAHNKQLKKAIEYYVLIFFLISVPLYLIDTFWFEQRYFFMFNLYVFIPVSVLLLFYVFKDMYKMNNMLSRFYLIGLFIFVFLAFVSLYYFIVPLPESLEKVGFDNSHFFMFGVIFEVILMSVALGYKNLVYKEEREKTRDALILKLQENQELQTELNTRLLREVEEKTKEIIKVSKKTEEYKLATVENELQTELNKLKLTSLVNQMNPHFIFNALNSIKLFIIENDAKNAVYYLNKFSKLIRKILASSTEKETTLKEELETLELYVNIENIRFSNEINYSVTVNESVNIDEIKVPSLILQPFIENAIWHGLSTKEGEKNIHITICKNEDNFLQIEIEDNGIGREQAEKNKEKRRIKRKSVGMVITKERLLNYTKNSQEDFSMHYKDLYKNNAVAGTLVELKIPLPS